MTKNSTLGFLALVKKLHAGKKGKSNGQALELSLGIPLQSWTFPTRVVMIQQFQLLQAAYY